MLWEFSSYYPAQEGADCPCDCDQSVSPALASLAGSSLVNIVKILHTFSLPSPTSPHGEAGEASRLPASLPVIRKMRIHICYEILLTHKNENVPKIFFLKINDWLFLIFVSSRHLCFQDLRYWGRYCWQLCGKCYRLQRCQCVPGYWYRLDHGCRLLGNSGREVHCSRGKVCVTAGCRMRVRLIFPFQPGFLCDRLLYWSHPGCPHPAGQKTSRCWWRAGRTQALQDNLIINLRLLLGVLRYDLRPGGLWCDWARILSKSPSKRK